MLYSQIPGSTFVFSSMTSSVFLEVHFKGKSNHQDFFLRSVTLTWIEALKHFFFFCIFVFVFSPVEQTVVNYQVVN